jgi:hypothetical protein
MRRRRRRMSGRRMRSRISDFHNQKDGWQEEIILYKLLIVELIKYGSMISD